MDELEESAVAAVESTGYLAGDEAREVARTVLNRICEGRAIVPREPTEAMIEAAEKS